MNKIKNYYGIKYSIIILILAIVFILYMIINSIFLYSRKSSFGHFKKSTITRQICNIKHVLEYNNIYPEVEVSIFNTNPVFADENFFIYSDSVTTLYHIRELRTYFSYCPSLLNYNFVNVFLLSILFTVIFLFLFIIIRYINNYINSHILNRRFANILMISVCILVYSIVILTLFVSFVANYFYIKLLIRMIAIVPQPAFFNYLAVLFILEYLTIMTFYILLFIFIKHFRIRRNIDMGWQFYLIVIILNLILLNSMIFTDVIWKSPPDNYFLMIISTLLCLYKVLTKHIKLKNNQIKSFAIPNEIAK